MQQLQPLKSSSGPLGLAPGGGRDRDRHQNQSGDSPSSSVAEHR